MCHGDVDDNLNKEVEGGITTARIGESAKSMVRPTCQAANKMASGAEQRHPVKDVKNLCARLSASCS